jgi:hypothetical protein
VHHRALRPDTRLQNAAEKWVCDKGVSGFILDPAPAKGAGLREDAEAVSFDNGNMPEAIQAVQKQGLLPFPRKVPFEHANRFQKKMSAEIGVYQGIVDMDL